MINDFLFAVHITAPIFFIIGFGIFFKRLGWITDEFARIGSDLVFKVTLPCLLFVKLVDTDFENGIPVLLITYALIATTIVFLLLDNVICKSIASGADRGAFVQGTFRGNMGIIGLAYCLSAFGESVITIASIYLAIMTTLYNVLSIITLSRHQQQENTPNMGAYVIKSVAKNPLIIAIAAGVSVALIKMPVPEILLSTGEYFAGMTLPLALLCAGASIRLKEFQSSPLLYWATCGKLFFVPLIVTGGGIAIGLRGESLGVLFLMSASPTAAASYPMAQALGANYHLAAAIIAATSLASICSSTLGIFLLRVFDLI
ncbi:MAG: AEC family transporter [Desulfuromonas sp.]|nr:MAG: AEC family transporter [Desulfuromonas sp.]